MTLGDWIGSPSVVLLPTILLGLVVRRTFRICWIFPLYLVVVFCGDLAHICWGSFTWDFFFEKEASLAVLKLLLAIELYSRLFAGLPGARKTANVFLLFPLGLTLALIGKPQLNADSVSLFQNVLPVVNDGTTLLLCTTLALATFYKVPAHPLHRAILRGLVVYLVVYTLCIHLFNAVGWGARDSINNILTSGYVILEVSWVVAVWRRPVGPPAPTAVVRRLWTWVSSS
jgi:hypothetical protein